MSRPKAAENRKKPARVAVGPQAPGFARSMGESTGRMVRPIWPLMSLLLAIGIVSLLMWYPVYGQNGRASTRGATLTVEELGRPFLEKQPPAWVPREDYFQVAGLGLFAVGRSVFEAGLSRELARRYESSPWVERVREVRLRYPARMALAIEWRKPAARVDCGTFGSLVVDRQGVVLNLMPDSAAVRDTPVISGVVCGRTPVGRCVPEKEILDGLGLLQVLRDAFSSAPGQLKPASLIMEPSRRWQVVTDRGPLIYWGYFTDDPPYEEPTTREKAEKLRCRLCELKDPSIAEYIKVYSPKVPWKPRAIGSEETGRANRGRN